MVVDVLLVVCVFVVWVLPLCSCHCRCCYCCWCCLCDLDLRLVHCCCYVIAALLVPLFVVWDIVLLFVLMVCMFRFLKCVVASCFVVVATGLD